MTQLPALYRKQLFQQIKMLVYSHGVCVSILHNLHSSHTHIYRSPAFIYSHSAKSIGKLYYGRGTTCFNGTKVCDPLSSLTMLVCSADSTVKCQQNNSIFFKICGSLYRNGSIQ